MLKQIINYWNRFKVWIIAGVVALAYLIGIKRGKNEEKVHQNTTVLANVQRANLARDNLADSNTVRRLHKKYTRK